MSVSQMSRLYDVSETALYRWISKYRTTPTTERIVIETQSDYVKLIELQQRLEKMERLIGNQQIEIDYHKSIIKAASDHYEEDVEKKFG